MARAPSTTSGWVYRIGAAGIFAAVMAVLLAAIVMAAWIVARPMPPSLWLFTLLVVAEVAYGVWIPVRVTVFPDETVEFRSLLRRRRVAAADIRSTEDVRGLGWSAARGIRFELRDDPPIVLRFPMSDQNDLLARLRLLNPYLREK